MTIQTKSLVAFVHVKNVERSIEFYADVGFKVANSVTLENSSSLGWAWLVSEKANLMIGLASAPINASQQAVLFYLYFDNIQHVRTSLIELGHSPGEIKYPFYMLDGEFRLVDPDGYVLMLAQA